ncbi:MAG: 30S ribosomal protein S4 [Anaerolineales bacterium]|nr:30S ribosomal protein S4 [Anaerolineales bacterium]
MARYLGSACVLCRREGEKLFLKGDRCTSGKCAIEKRNYPPGPHGQSGSFRRKISDYATQLREKQKARRIYGVLERQFRRYFAEASKSSGVTGAALLQLLEARFDNVVYRLGFASSRKQARQLVLHGHFTVNGAKATVPSYVLKPGAQIAVTEDSRKNAYFQQIAKELTRHQLVEWLSLDAANLTASVLHLPSRQQIETPLKEQLIVEYYSR